MKKVYINPEMAIVRLQTMQMLADSLTSSDFGGGSGGTGTNGITSADARDYDFDFDED